MTDLPPIGTRWRFQYGAGAKRTWELKDRLSPAEARRHGQHGCDRNLLVLVAESGFLPEHAAKAGAKMYVEDRWFLTHRSGQAFGALDENQRIQKV